MTTDHTVIDMLDAVGVDWQQTPELCGPLVNGGVAYTGPALGTPELDALLLVAGHRWFIAKGHTTKRNVVKALGYNSFEEDSGGWISGRLGLLFQSERPGHALARAIRETING